MKTKTKQFQGKCTCEEIYQCCIHCNPVAYRKSVNALAKYTKERQPTKRVDELHGLLAGVVSLMEKHIHCTHWSEYPDLRKAQEFLKKNA